jgi:hypothetical protein
MRYSIPHTRIEPDALRVVSSMIGRCEKAQLNFAAGTSQYTLLTNRIKALYIARSLMVDEKDIFEYTLEEFTDSLPRISSIVSKCEKARQKFAEGTLNYRRFEKLITAMSISRSLIMDEISRGGDAPF